MQVEPETGHKLKVLCSDGGGEYTAREVQSFLKDKGIKHKMTTADTPQHNRVAEYMNHMLVEWVRTMLINAELPDGYWWDALQYMALLHNMSLMHSLSDCTPEEVLECFDKANVCPISTPSLPNHHLVCLPSPEIDVKHFQQALGALIYLMLGTHPNITYTVAALGHH